MISTANSTKLNSNLLKSLVSVKKNYQITIPRRFRDVFNLQEGDIMQIEIQDKELVLKPKSIVDSQELERREWIKSLIETGIKNPVEMSEEEIVKSCKETRKEVYKEFYGKKQK